MTSFPDYICEFCNSKFLNEKSLKAHQKTAVFCLKLQGKESKFYCKICEKHFSSKRRLDEHLIRQHQQDVNKDLKILSDEYLQSMQILESELKLNEIGLVNFGKRIFQGYVICTDSQRLTFRYRKGDKLIQDKSGLGLRKMFFEICNRNIDIIQSHADNSVQNFSERNEKDIMYDLIYKPDHLKKIRYIVALIESITNELSDYPSYSDIGNRWLRKMITLVSVKNDMEVLEEKEMELDKTKLRNMRNKYNDILSTLDYGDGIKSEDEDE